MSLLIGLETTFIRMDTVLLIGPDTIFTRMVNVLANRAGNYIY